MTTIILHIEASTETCSVALSQDGHVFFERVNRDDRSHAKVLAPFVEEALQNADSHLIPYSGSIWWKYFLEEMKKIGYAGDLSFETFKQVEKKRLPEELLPAFLSAIADIGKYFRKELQK